MEEIIALLHSIRPMSSALEQHLRHILRRRTFQRKEVLLKAGEIAGEILFIRKGLIRSYVLLDGKPVSNWFMKEGDITIAVESFLWQVASDEFLQALEESECWGISRDELWDTYQRYPEFLWTGLLITNTYYTRSIKRERAQRRLDPNEKYALMMRTEPELMRRVANIHMASYLDVSSRTYAGMRKRYSEEKVRRRAGV